MNYRYGLKNEKLVVVKDYNSQEDVFQEFEFIFNKELSNKMAACIYRYMQVADFTYKEKYKKQLNEDYEYLKKIGSE